MLIESENCILNTVYPQFLSWPFISEICCSVLVIEECTGTFDSLMRDTELPVLSTSIIGFLIPPKLKFRFTWGAKFTAYRCNMGETTTCSTENIFRRCLTFITRVIFYSATVTNFICNTLNWYLTWRFEVLTLWSCNRC